MNSFDPIENDAFCKKMLSGSDCEQLLDWLSKEDDIQRTLGEFQIEEDAEQFAAELLIAGANSIWVVDIERATKDYRSENSGKLCIQLPKDDEQRPILLEIANEIAEEQGFDAVPDNGQEYLFIALD